MIDVTIQTEVKESIADLMRMAGSGLSASGGVLMYQTGDISSVVAGSGLTGGGTADVCNVQVDDSSIEMIRYTSSKSIRYHKCNVRWFDCKL